MKINYSRSLLYCVTLFGLALSTLLAAGETEAQLLKQAKITKSQAEQIALEKVPNGKIRSGEIENEHRALVWSSDIISPGTRNITEVLVNAKTGKVVEVATETAADQAKEQAADKAAGRK